MTDGSASGLAIALLIVVGVVVYVIGEVRKNSRRSEEQWRAVDKSKLKKWEDDDDWN